MQCPACQVPLIVVERAGIELDWCLSCRGMWFDDGELELLAGTTGRRLAAEDVGRAVEGRERERRRCPRCRRRMQPAEVGRRDRVSIDRCRAHGLWLDAGELGRILGQLDSSPDTDEDVILQFLGETFTASR